MAWIKSFSLIFLSILFFIFL
ncbi:MAG TPA: cation:proton antiporter, partial [Thermosipho africanus]|nr:cation:proton antiporter [Thermosipho africanus]